MTRADLMFDMGKRHATSERAPLSQYDFVTHADYDNYSRGVESERALSSPAAATLISVRTVARALGLGVAV